MFKFYGLSYWNIKHQNYELSKKIYVIKITLYITDIIYFFHRMHFFVYM